MSLVGLKEQRAILAGTPGLWQFNLLPPARLSQFAKEHGLSGFNEDSIKRLWKIGLLRADCVVADTKLSVPDLLLIKDGREEFLYCDARAISPRAGGYGGALFKIGNEPLPMELLFHPFRLYVLYHIDRVFDTHISQTQYLFNPEGYSRLTKHHIAHLDSWTSSEVFADRFNYWNEVAEMAIVLEPSSYRAVYQSMRWQPPDTEETMEAKLDARIESLSSWLSQFSISEINSIRSDLCRTAETVDDNRSTHVLLRLMSARERLKLRSSLGASMLYLDMAEIIRRPVERSMGVKLSEEDELGFGQWMDGARKTLYGTERVFDASKSVLRDYLSIMQLDFGVKVRCYVEGETEISALSDALGPLGGVEFVNLRGQISQKGGKGLAFIDSLESDKKAHVISVVLIDADRPDFVRTLKKAAADQRFFGRYFLSTPDIEFANFTSDELLRVAIDLTAKSGSEAPDWDVVYPAITEAKTGKQFFQSLRSHGLGDVGKGNEWGVELMRFAIQHQTLPSTHSAAGQRRPLLDVAQFLISACKAGYQRSFDQLQLDAETGKLVAKVSGEPT